MTHDDPPRPTGRLRKVTITGSLVPWADGQPVFMGASGSEDYYLPLFSTMEQLEATMAMVGLPYDRVQRISNARMYLDILPETVEGRPLRLIHDPHYRSDGLWSYAQVLPEDLP